MRKLLFFNTLLTSALIVAASFANVRGQEPNAPSKLKSGAELAEALSAKIGKTFEIPTTFSRDVLTAEQRDAKIIVFKSGADWNDPASVVWEWNAADSPEIAPEERYWFGHPSECKSLRGGSCVLVAASGGGVALVRVADKRTLMFGLAGGNTHSAALLPNGVVVSASSTGAFLALFPATQGLSEIATGTKDIENATPATGATEPFAKIPFFDAHGVVWDQKRQTLWALGGEEIAGFEFVGTPEKPEFKEVFRKELEGVAFGGHDLAPAPGFDALMTTGRGIAVFDPETREFFPVVKMRSVKSLSVSPEGVPLMQRAVEEWWSETIFFGDANDSAVGTLDGAKFYKARWFQSDAFCEPETP